MMNKTLASVFALGALSSLPCKAEEQHSGPAKNENEATMRLLEKALKDSEIEAATMERIRQMVQEAHGDAETTAQKRTFRRTVVIGPDGKVQTLDDDGMEGIDLSKLWLKPETDGDDKDDKKAKATRVETKGSIKVIGPDGKVTESDFDPGESSDLNRILQEVIKEINVEEGVTSVGPGFLTYRQVSPDCPVSEEQRNDETNEKLDKLHKEIAEQRKLLEEILENLD